MLIPKIIFLKNIVLIHFQIKYILKSNRNNIFKHTLRYVWKYGANCIPLNFKLFYLK